jgi:hypothetical protein
LKTLRIRLAKALEAQSKVKKGKKKPEELRIYLRIYDMVMTMAVVPSNR